MGHGLLDLNQVSDLQDLSHVSDPLPGITLEMMRPVCRKAEYEVCLSVTLLLISPSILIQTGPNQINFDITNGDPQQRVCSSEASIDRRAIVTLA